MSNDKYERTLPKKENTMAQDEEEGVIKLKFPSGFTIRDVLTFVSVVVTITIAWGVFSTRLTVIERELITINTRVEEIRTNNAHTVLRLNRLEAHQAEDELIIDEIYNHAKRPIPQRRATN